MKNEKITLQLRALCLNKLTLPEEVLDWIAHNNYWNIWVPRAYGGLEKSFTEGLETLKSLAFIDGSLGWTTTLCSGANFFIGNLKPKVATSLFSTQENTIFGGSGGLFGTAEKQGDTYLISGIWRYATGAPYLTHFTLNAKIIKNGLPLKHADGSPVFRSFVLPKSQVSIIQDWNTMGLLSTATHSFEVDSARVHQDHSFSYNKQLHSQAIFKIPFALFADLTTWVNYLGMAEHYLQEVRASHQDNLQITHLSQQLKDANQRLLEYAFSIETAIIDDIAITEDFQKEVHQYAVETLRQLSKALLDIHPFMGIKASRLDCQLNVIFRDFFTATQHHIFVER